MCDSVCACACVAACVTVCVDMLCVTGTVHAQAYRKLAMVWHPDKHQGADQEEAKARFQEIQRAYDSLMTTDEDEKIEQIAAASTS